MIYSLDVILDCFAAVCEAVSASLHLDFYFGRLDFLNAELRITNVKKFKLRLSKWT